MRCRVIVTFDIGKAVVLGRLYHIPFIPDESGDAPWHTQVYYEDCGVKSSTLISRTEVGVVEASDLF